MRTRGAGFTLLELVVTLTILGLAAAVVLPDLGRSFDDGAERGARAVAALFARGRAEALARGRTVVVTLRLTDGGYALTAGSLPWDTLARGTLALGSRVRLDAGGAPSLRAAFDPAGGARGPVVTVADGARRYAITIDPWTADAAVAPR